MHEIKMPNPCSGSDMDQRDDTSTQESSSIETKPNEASNIEVIVPVKTTSEKTKTSDDLACRPKRQSELRGLNSQLPSETLSYRPPIKNLSQRKPEETLSWRKPDHEKTLSWRKTDKNLSWRKPDHEKTLSWRKPEENLSRRKTDKNLSWRKPDHEKTLSWRKPEENLSQRKTDKNLSWRKPDHEKTLSWRKPEENLSWRRTPKPHFSDDSSSRYKHLKSLSTITSSREVSSVYGRESHHSTMLEPYTESQVNQAKYGRHERRYKEFGSKSRFEQKFGGGDPRDCSWKVKPFNRREIWSLAQKYQHDLVHNLHNNLKRFLENLRVLQENDLDIVLQILFKISDCIQGSDGSKACLVLAEVLSDRCPKFHFQLKLYSQKDFSKMHSCMCDSMTRIAIEHTYSYIECRVNSLCKFFMRVLEALPSTAWRILPITEFTEQIKRRKTVTNPDLLEEIKNLENLHTNYKDQFCKLSKSLTDAIAKDHNWDNSEYRNMPTFPSDDELRTSKQPEKLRPNIIRGEYKDWMHYYDVQFRLLREDFTAPLRRGICGYRQGLRGRDLRDIRIYRNIVIMEPTATRNCMNYNIKFDNSHFKRCDWTHSKRLLYGSLLCLSSDRFESIMFATVANRDTKQLDNGIITVQFLKGSGLLEHRNKETSFVMIESTAYFEASRHVMTSLQTAETETMPFTDYLIANKCDIVSPPHYLQEKQTALYNLCTVLTGYSNAEENSSTTECDEDEADKLDEMISFLDILDDNSWLSLNEVQLDSSQQQALKMALTQEISVIQGPPGTGKTYIGIKIVQALLENKDHWDTGQKSPILVMCYTNHALDQFLEGILAALKPRKAPKLIRIGGRCKSEKLEPFLIANKRRSVLLPHFSHQRKSRMESDNKEKKKIMEKNLDLLEKAKKGHDLLDLSQIQIVIGVDHLSQLFNLAKTPNEDKRILEIWLGLCTRKIDQSSKLVSIKEAKATISGEINDGDSDGDIGTDLEQLYDTGENQSEYDELHSNHSSTDSITEQTKEDVNTKYELIDVEGVAILENDARIVDDKSDEESIEDANDYFQTIPEHGNQRETTPLEKIENYQVELKKGLMERKLEQQEAEKIKNICDIDLKTKWKLYNYWRELFISIAEADCEEKINQYNQSCAQVDDTQRETDKFVLETADIVGMTTTGAARYQHILYMVKPRIIIVEEAAEVLESHIVSALNAGTHHLILIGDHKQLKPKPNEYNLAKNFNMNVSLFERLICNKFPYSSLNIQHRMRPEIAGLVRPHIYNDLQDHINVQEYESVKGLQKNLFFIQHEVRETHDDNLLSYSNKHEAEYIVALCGHLLLQGYQPNQITILVTYTGQLLAIRSLMPKDKYNGVTLRTVDNYQGEENDIVILSIVRSNNEGEIGFLKEENRVCVSISRAKIGFYCIGNFSMLAQKSTLWKKLLDHLKEKDFFGEQLPLHCTNHPVSVFAAKSPKDFSLLAPNGGCQLSCSIRLFCGHSCTMKCHILDSDHAEYKCKKPCTKKCSNGHPCPKPCYEPCGECSVRVVRELACGHHQEMHCYKNPENIMCKTKVIRDLPNCGHQKEMHCYKNPENIMCKTKVIRDLPNCGHQKEMYCYENPENVKCFEDCETTCPKGHKCPRKCWEPCQRLCQTKVLKIIPKCQHTQLIPCHQDPDKFLCQEDCSCECMNGHSCPKKCSEDCGPCVVMMEKVIPTCFHKVLLPCSVPPFHRRCTKPCDKLLDCGHQCQSQCGQMCTTTCMVPVVKILECGHKQTVPCSQSQRIKVFHCEQPCRKLLPCKHRCKKKCSQPCTQKCMYSVREKRPCGHFARKCYEIANPGTFPCKKKCKKQLPCGHLCTSRCGSPCTQECHVKVTKTLLCGHEQKMACYTDVATYKCEQFCKVTLECGHNCRGKCGDCRETHVHLECKFTFNQQQFCGHKFNVQCVGLSDAHCGKKKQHLKRCIHKACTHDCSSECTPCEQPCPWICPHHTCSKLCHEFCNRSPCNKQCTKTLKCGHACPGICGEPCLTVCPQCQPKDFNKLATKPVNDKQQELYIQLNCKHIFTLQYMDEYIAEHSSANAVIMPPSCPKCDQPLIANFRYGNACRQYDIDRNLIQTAIQTQAVKHVNEEKAAELHDRFTTHRIFMNRLHPHKTHALLRVKERLEPENHTQITAQENLLNVLLVNCIEIATTLEKDLVHSELQKKLECYVRVLLDLKKPHISIQIIQDITSELYRLSLLQQLALVESSLASNPTGSSDVAHIHAHHIKQLLQELDENPSARVSTTDYRRHSNLLQEIYETESKQELPVNLERLIREVEDAIPAVLKGDWRKCSQGHVYCTPLTVGKNTDAHYCTACHN